MHCKTEGWTTSVCRHSHKFLAVHTSVVEEMYSSTRLSFSVLSVCELCQVSLQMFTNTKTRAVVWAGVAIYSMKSGLPPYVNLVLEHNCSSLGWVLQRQWGKVPPHWIELCKVVWASSHLLILGKWMDGQMEYETHQCPVCQTAGVSAALLPRLLSRLQPSTPKEPYLLLSNQIKLM